MRKSKYLGLEGQTFNVKGSSVRVVRYHREVRTSKKTGKKYYAYRLDVKLEGYTDILEISTASWNKQSFIKRLIKTSVNQEVQTYSLAIYNPIKKDFIGRTIEECEDNMFEEMSYCETTKEVHKWFKKYAKFYHPDSLGRELFPEEQIIYSLLVQGRNEMCEMIALADEVFGYKLDDYP